MAKARTKKAPPAEIYDILPVWEVCIPHVLSELSSYFHTLKALTRECSSYSSIFPYRRAHHPRVEPSRRRID